MFQQVYNCIKPFMLTIHFFTERTLPKMQKQNLIWISGRSVWCVKKRDFPDVENGACLHRVLSIQDGIS